jgi:hypothetical protein
VTQHDDARRIGWPIFFRQKAASERGPHAEQRKERLARRDSVQVLRVAVTGEGEIQRTVCREPRQRPRLRDKVQKIRLRRDEVLAVRITLPHLDETIRLDERERPNDHRVHDPEDRRRCADRQREREDRDGGKAGGVANRPQCVAYIETQSIHCATRVRDRSGARVRPDLARSIPPLPRLITL